MRRTSCFLALLVAACLGLPVRAQSLDAARKLMAQGDDGKAETMLLQLVASGKANAQVEAALGEIAMHRNDLAGAQAHYERATAASPQSAQYVCDLGLVYVRQGQQQTSLLLGLKGKSCFERAVAMEPANVNIQSALIRFYLEAPFLVGGSRAKARRQINQLIKYDAYAGNLQLADINITEGKWDDARLNVERAIELHPQWPYAYREVGDIGLKHAPDRPWSEGFLKAGLKRGIEGGEQEDRAAIHCKFGALLAEEGNAGEALEQYEDAVKVDKDCREATAFLAQHGR